MKPWNACGQNLIINKVLADIRHLKSIATQFAFTYFSLHGTTSAIVIIIASPHFRTAIKAAYKKRFGGNDFCSVQKIRSKAQFKGSNYSKYIFC